MTHQAAARATPAITLAQRMRMLARRETALTLALLGALATFYVSPSPLIALPVLVVYAALAGLRLDLAVCLLPLAFPFWYVPKRVLGHTVFPLSEIALAVCLGVALVREGRRLVHRAGRRQLLVHLRTQAARLRWPLLLAIAAFLASGVLGVLVARRPREALRDLRWEMIEPLLYLLLLLLYARGPRALPRLVWAFLGSAALLAALGLLQSALVHVTFSALEAGNRLVPLLPGADGTYRATAFVYGSGNSLAAYVERAVPLVVAMLLASRGSAPPSSRRTRLALASLTGLYVAALLATQSRGALLATAGVTLALVAVAVGRPRWTVAGAAVIALGLVAFATAGGARVVASLVASHPDSVQIRLLLWLAAGHMLRDHPLLGIGLDQFRYYYSSLYTAHPYWVTVWNGQTTSVWREPDLAHPHNLLLDLWLNISFVGLVAFGAILGTFLRRCLLLWRVSAASAARPGTGWLASVALGVCGSVVVGVLHGMVDSAYFVPDLALIFWWSIGVLLVAERSGGNGPRTVLGWPSMIRWGRRQSDESSQA
ncbi:MAG TPA: O-antigen ligase family protein [Ktedonobacterales bacterium]